VLLSPSTTDERCTFSQRPEALAKTAAARPILARLNARLMEGFSQREIATINRFLQSILERF
jgi:DNA-binding MarR family transcriptional regulator